MNKVTITYGPAYIPPPPPPAAKQEITRAEYDLIVALHQRTLPFTAIKFLRQQYGLGLHEAKQVSDAIRDGGPR